MKKFLSLILVIGLSLTLAFGTVNANHHNTDASKDAKKECCSHDKKATKASKAKNSEDCKATKECKDVKKAEGCKEAKKSETKVENK
jgi:hypothetical protein